MSTSVFDIYLVNGNITVFCGAHGETFKKDILYSSLLSELASISKHSDSRELLWSGYVDTVSKLGWITKSREFKRYEFPTKSLLKIVESSTGTLLTKDEKQTLLNAFLIIKNQSSQSPIVKTIVEKLQGNTFVACEDIKPHVSTRTPVASSTRLTFVRSNASIITLQVAFKATHGISIDLLNQPSLDTIKDGQPNLWLLVSSLDARQYDNIRATVVKKIGNHINTDLMHVPTPTRLS